VVDLIVTINGSLAMKVTGASMVIPKLKQLALSNAPNSTLWTEYQTVSAYLVYGSKERNSDHGATHWAIWRYVNRQLDRL
jgi:hypothetical protein